MIFSWLDQCVCVVINIESYNLCSNYVYLDVEKNFVFDEFINKKAIYASYYPTVIVGTLKLMKNVVTQLPVGGL